VSTHSDTQPSPPPDDEPTAVRDESPVMALIRDVSILTKKVDELTKLVTQALNARIADDEAFLLSRKCARRLDTVEECCAHNHPSPRKPTNGAGTHEL
jgi:hypothetical protein